MFGRPNEARHGGADDGKYNIKKHELISIVTLTDIGISQIKMSQRKCFKWLYM